MKTLKFSCSPFFDVSDERLTVQATDWVEEDERCTPVRLEFSGSRLIAHWKDGEPEELDLSRARLIDVELTEGGRWSSDEWFSGIDYNYHFKGPDSEVMLALICGEDLYNRRSDPSSEYPGDKLAQALADRLGLSYDRSALHKAGSAGGSGSELGRACATVLGVYLVICLLRWVWK